MKPHPISRARRLPVPGAVLLLLLAGALLAAPPAAASATWPQPVAWEDLARTKQVPCGHYEPHYAWCEVTHVTWSTAGYGHMEYGTTPCWFPDRGGALPCNYAIWVVAYQWYDEYPRAMVRDTWCTAYDWVQDGVYAERVPLPDGDLIDVTVEHQAVDPATVEFVLASAPEVTWWKGVTIPDGEGSSWEISTEASWWGAQGGPAGAVGAPGAAWAGAHLQQGQGVRDPPAMYTLSDLGRLQPGDRVTFRWVRD